MKKIILSVSTILILGSCSGTKDVSTSSLTNMAASTLLSTLTKDSSPNDISQLFDLLDLNKDKSISKSEAIGDVLTNFNVLDSDQSGGLGLDELGGLLSLLK